MAFVLAVVENPEEKPFVESEGSEFVAASLVEHTVGSVFVAVGHLANEKGVFLELHLGIAVVHDTGVIVY